MDEATLLACRGLCGTEDAQHPDALLEHPSPAERSLFGRLKSDPALRAPAPGAGEAAADSGDGGVARGALLRWNR
jgi:hypothetical protein